MGRVLGAIGGIPGVAAVGATSSIPFGGSYSDSVILAEGYFIRPGESLISPRQLIVTPGYCEAMGIPLARGRYFNEHDTETAPGVVIVDEWLAHKFWPDRDPIGRRMYQPTNPNDLLRTDERTRWLTVVGVVRDVRLEDLAGNGNIAGSYYYPYLQNPARGGTLAIRTSIDTAAIIRAVRTEIARIDSGLPLFDVQTMVQRRDASLSSRKTAMLLALAFGSVALLLSGIGVYGVLAYLVAQRSREIGIRIALGGGARDIFKLVFREGLGIVAAGLAIGLAGSAALRQAIANQIYGVQPMDPFVIVMVAVALGLVALAACVLPARRATRVDPVAVLNQP
jgi:predicted permease